VHVRAIVSLDGDRMSVDLEIDEGWKLFGIGCDKGIPVSLHAVPPGLLHAVTVPAGELSGTARLRATLVDAGTITGLWLRYQLCSGSICRRPAELELPLPVQASPR
jgi:hypothetical protein